MKRPSPFLAVVLCATVACSVDDSDDVADTNSSDASENTEGTETAADATETGGGPQDFPPVPCEKVTCAEKELCVEPAAWCDYTQDPVTWVYPDAVCLPFPSECEDLQDDPLLDCLWMTVCESKGEDSVSLQFEMGAVDCPPEGLDCFGDPTS